VWSLRQQTRQQFELKAAEIMFAAATPKAMKKRGEYLMAIVGKRLPDDFLSRFQPEVKEPSTEKLQLLELLLKYRANSREVLQLWDQLFPGDYEWLERVSLPDKPPPVTVDTAGQAKTHSESE
jgi:hypothetical protein